jgi:putative peptidoglycan lipid II flippase
MKALAHKREFGELRKLHGQTQLAVAFIALPASVGLFVLATPVTACLLQRGEFGAAGVERTASAIRFLCLALIPGGAVGLLSRAFYALADFTTPVRVSLVALFANVVLNFVFVRAFALDTGGLALATALVSWGSIAALAPLLAREIRAGAGGPVSGLPGFGARIAKMSVAAVLCGLGAWATHRGLGGEPRSLVSLAAAITVGIGTYIAAAQLLGLPEWSAARDRALARLRRSR